MSTVAKHVLCLGAVTIVCLAAQLGCRTTSEADSQLREEKAEIPAAAISAFEYARIQALRANVSLSAILNRISQTKGLEVVLKHMFDNDDFRWVTKLYLGPSNYLSQDLLSERPGNRAEQISNEGVAANLVYLVAFTLDRKNPTASRRALAAPKAIYQAFKEHGWRIHRALHRGVFLRTSGTALLLGLYASAFIGSSRNLADSSVSDENTFSGRLTKRKLEGEAELTSRFGPWAREITAELADVYQSTETPWTPETRMRLQNAIEKILSERVVANKVHLLKNSENINLGDKFLPGQQTSALVVEDFEIIEILEKGKFLSLKQLQHIKLQRRLFRSYTDRGADITDTPDLQLQAAGVLQFLEAELRILDAFPEDVLTGDRYNLAKTAKILRVAQKRLARKFQLNLAEKKPKK